jgi:hypothetical protein
MFSILGFLIFCLAIIVGGMLFGLIGNWFLTLPLGALCAVIVAAVWINAAKRS